MFFKHCLVLVVCIQLGIFAAECPVNWVEASEVGMGCLLFNRETTYSWEEANGYCQTEERASLVEIQTEDQFEFLKMELISLDEDSRHWWTAGTDAGREGKWYWSGSLTPVGHFVWNGGDPDEGIKANCLALWPQEFYDGVDEQCTGQYFPICQ